jgi:hypothetical protein
MPPAPCSATISYGPRRAPGSSTCESISDTGVHDEVLPRRLLGRAKTRDDHELHSRNRRPTRSRTEFAPPAVSGHVSRVSPIRRAIRGGRALCRADGTSLTASALVEGVIAAGPAGVRSNGPHILPHVLFLSRYARCPCARSKSWPDTAISASGPESGGVVDAILRQVDTLRHQVA